MHLITVLSVSNGVASIDADGDGAPDSDAALLALGFTTTERQQLALRYPSGASVMRTRLFGLYPFDGNLPAKIDGVDPVVVVAPGCASATRDIIKCDVRNATQAVAVPGTPLTLAYTSARSAAAADRTLDIPITGSTLPAARMYVHVTVAGQTTEMQYLPAANVTYQYQWDGLDAYGRPVQGNPTAVVEIGHLYTVEYQYPAAVEHDALRRGSTADQDRHGAEQAAAVEAHALHTRRAARRRTLRRARPPTPGLS